MGLVTEIKNLESSVAFDKVLFLSTDSIIKSVFVFSGRCDTSP